MRTDEYPLTEEQCAQYRSDGYLFLPGVAEAEEIGAVRPALLRTVDEVARVRDSQGRISDYSAMFTQVTNVWRKDPAVRAFVHARRFASIAARLMGVPAVRLYHDQALIKEPGGKQTPWHQDAYYWPLDTPHTITLWLALVDIPQTMGSMSFVRGSHRANAMVPGEISDHSGEAMERLIREHGLPVESFALRAGDATFHAGTTLHSAHANRSDRRREVLTVIYYAADAVAVDPGTNEHRKADLSVFLPGVRPGQPAVSDINPVLFP